MIAPLFQRAWSVSLRPPDSLTATVFSSDSGTVTPLQVTFECERTLASSKNKGKISLTNITPELRASLPVGTVVTLQAGYVGNVGIIYKGELATIEMDESSGNVITTLSCGDGEPLLLYCTFEKTYSSTVTLAQILQDLCQVLSVDIGGTAYKADGYQLQGLPNKTWPKYTLHGTIRRSLDRLLHPLGITWSIQNGTLLVQGGPKNRLNLRAVVLSPATGLIGIPKVSEAGVSATALIQPSLVPGNAAVITLPITNEARNLRIVKSVFKGDTLGKDWTVEVFGQTLVAPLAVVPPIATKATKAEKAVVSAPPEDEPEEVDE